MALRDRFFLRPLLGPFRLLDLSILGIEAILVCLYVLFSSRIAWAMGLASTHIAMMGAIVVLIRVCERAPRTRWVQFLRDFYPFIILTFIYESLGALIPTVVPHWFDLVFLTWDRFLFFGHDPSVLCESIAKPALTEYIYLCYFSYYFLMPAVAFPLWFKGKRAEALHVLTACYICYFFCYLWFIFLPVMGPRYTIASSWRYELLPGFLFARIQEYIMHNADLLGGCMPSSHVAVAHIVLRLSYRCRVRPVNWILTPIILSLYVSTVYLRYHYFVDVIGGILAGEFILFVLRIVSGAGSRRSETVTEP